MKEPWLWLASADLAIELRQLEDEGRDTSPLRKDFERLIALGDEELSTPSNQEKAGALLDAAQRLGMRRGYGFREPSGLAEIRKLRERGPDRAKGRLSDKALQDRILGAWLGRCAGCLLGKPVEGVRTEELWGFLKMTDQWPLNDYIRFDAGGQAAKTYPRFAGLRAFDTIDHMPADDDMDYTVAGLLVVKERGAAFTPADVARFWMRNIPLLRTCTAERVAYRNLVDGLQPPDTARYLNPYREWIGAQIRADIFGWVTPGHPDRAAELAFRDASLSHVKNGIYGEMYMAAVLSAAVGGASLEDSVQIGRGEIPAECRLAEAVQDVVAWAAEQRDWEATWRKIMDKYGHYHGVHTINNAALVLMGLLHSEGDFARACGIAVMGGLDTDCNGATAGSIMGAVLGAAALPPEWVEPLNDRIESFVLGFNDSKISDLAARTQAVAERIAG